MRSLRLRRQTVLAEGLVLFACLNSTGCSETSSHYYNTHPHIQEIVQDSEQKVAKFVGPTVVTLVGPLIYAAAGGTGTLRLNRVFSLQVSTKSGKLVFGKEF